MKTSPWVWIGVGLAAVFGIGAAAVATSRKPSESTLRVELRPGTMHVTGFKANENVVLVLPHGARWGGVTDLEPSLKQPVGNEEFTFNDGPNVVTGSIGVTWWDANDVAQATTIYYGP